MILDMGARSKGEEKDKFPRFIGRMKARKISILFCKSEEKGVGLGMTFLSMEVLLRGKSFNVNMREYKFTAICAKKGNLC